MMQKKNSQFHAAQCSVRIHYRSTNAGSYNLTPFSAGDGKKRRQQTTNTVRLKPLTGHQSDYSISYAFPGDADYPTHYRVSMLVGRIVGCGVMNLFFFAPPLGRRADLARFARLTFLSRQKSTEHQPASLADFKTKSICNIFTEDRTNQDLL